MKKLFILGLPRTGTTSICSALLNAGLTVAHTAYTQATFEQACALADTPIYVDYPLLDQHYPDSKFIYLAREPQYWLPSIKQLLQRMQKNLLRDDGGFDPIIKQSYLTAFSPFSIENIDQDDFLLACYQKHIASVKQYFHDRTNDILFINISQNGSYQLLQDFLIEHGFVTKENSNNNPQQDFEQLNIGGKVTAWKSLVHPLKIASTRHGKSTPLAYRDTDK